MRAFLIATVVCLMTLTFYLAASLTSTVTEDITAEQAIDLQTALDVQLADLRSSMTSEIETLKETGSALEAKISTLTQSFQSLTAERDDLAGELAQTQAELEATSAEFASRSELVTNNETQINDLETQLKGRSIRLADADATTRTLNETIVATRTELDAVSGQLITLQQKAISAAARIAELENGSSNASSQPTSTDEQVSLLQVPIAVRDTKLDTLDAGVAELTANLEARDQTADRLTSQTSNFEAAIETTTTSITERDTVIASLETQQGEISTLEEETNAQINAMEAAQVDAAEVDNSEELTALTSESETQITGLDAQIAAKTELMVEQTETVETLRLGLSETPLLAEELAALCVAQANGILESSQIGFDIGTSAINESSIVTLERLRELAIGCQNERLIIEIGGHTDSQGPELDNQVLSEIRAQAVLDFMVDRGISSDKLRAVGFGEKQPIETNDTRDGRTANRRITFEWQLQEKISNAIDEIVSETANNVKLGVEDEALFDTENE